MMILESLNTFMNLTSMAIGLFSPRITDSYLVIFVVHVDRIFITFTTTRLKPNGKLELGSLSFCMVIFDWYVGPIAT